MLRKIRKFTLSALLCPKPYTQCTLYVDPFVLYNHREVNDLTKVTK